MTEGRTGRPEEGDREDRDLVAKAAAGDATAFERIVLKYQKAIYNTAVRYVGDAHEAEDLAQEIFVKIHRSLSTFRGNSRFFTWIFAIAMNHLRSRRKGFLRFFRGLTDLFESADRDARFVAADDVEAAAERNELLTALRMELVRLPEMYREILVLREVNGLAYHEIAEILAIPMDAVKTRIHRGRMKLSEALAKRGFTK